MSSRKVSKYVKYTVKELENYTNADDSCVKKMKANFHLSIFPIGLTDFKEYLLNLLSKRKIGSYDETLEGIILDVRNVKVIGTSGAIRFDDPKIHLDIVCDCYVFKPIVGAILRGTIRHISSSQIGVIIYRVFSVSIRLVKKPNVKLEVNSEIEFRIKNFNLVHAYPYIEGDLVNSINSEDSLKRPKLEIEDPEDVKNVIKLVEEIKEDEINESKLESPPKIKKRKKEISFKTEI